MSDKHTILFSHDKPPVWDRLVAKFNPDWNDVVVAYDDTIYFSGGSLPRDIIIHEAVHLNQQHNGLSWKKKLLGGNKPMTPALWWDQYLEDEVFRINQEIEAYIAQWKCIQHMEPDRNQRARHLHRLVSDLSSKYGTLLTPADAKVAITEAY